MKKIKFLLFASLAFSMFLLMGADVQAQSTKGKITTNLQQTLQETKTVRQAKIQQSTNKKSGIVQKGQLKARKKVSKAKIQSLKAVKSNLVRKTPIPVDRTKRTKANLDIEAARLKLKERRKNRQ